MSEPRDLGHNDDISRTCNAQQFVQSAALSRVSMDASLHNYVLIEHTLAAQRVELAVNDLTVCRRDSDESVKASGHTRGMRGLSPKGTSATMRPIVRL